MRRRSSGTRGLCVFAQFVEHRNEGSESIQHRFWSLGNRKKIHCERRDKACFVSTSKIVKWAGASQTHTNEYSLFYCDCYTSTKSILRVERSAFIIFTVTDWPARNIFLRRLPMAQRRRSSNS